MALVEMRSGVSALAFYPQSANLNTGTLSLPPNHAECVNKVKDGQDYGKGEIKTVVSTEYCGQKAPSAELGSDPALMQAHYFATTSVAHMSGAAAVTAVQQGWSIPLLGDPMHLPIFDDHVRGCADQVQVSLSPELMSAAFPGSSSNDMNQH
jgi:hypothetical protein